MLYNILLVLFVIFLILSIFCIYWINVKLSKTEFDAEFSNWKASRMKHKRLKYMEKYIYGKIKDACNEGKYSTEINEIAYIKLYGYSDFDINEDLFNNKDNKNYIQNQLESRGYKVIFYNKTEFFGNIKCMKISWGKENDK